jgi:hypothetical protein
MKELLSVAALILFTSCFHENSFDGTYVTNEKCFVYGLKVDETEKEVRLYIVKELSTEITFEEYSAQQDWSEYRIGTLISADDGSWSLLGVDSDVVQNDRLESIGMSIHNESIKIDCKEIYDTFTGMSQNLSNQFCRTDSIEFHKVK